MNTSHFASVYGVCKNLPNDQSVITLHDFQKDLLNKLDATSLVSITASRQMGITQMLVYYMANWLINNVSEKNTIYFRSHNLASDLYVIERIKDVLTYYNNVNYRVTSNKIISRSRYSSDKKAIMYNKCYHTKDEINLTNGNAVIILNNENMLDVVTIEKEKDHDNMSLLRKPYALIIDNAAYIPNLEIIHNFFKTKTSSNKYIFASCLIEEINYFNDRLVKIYPSFKELKYHWTLNPLYNDKWYYNMKNTFNGKLSTCEIDLVRSNNRTKQYSSINETNMESEKIKKSN